MRTKTQIYKTILECLPEPKLRIRYIASLSQEQLNTYLTNMLKFGLIEPLPPMNKKQRASYGITKHGIEYLDRIANS